MTDNERAEIAYLQELLKGGYVRVSFEMPNGFSFVLIGQKESVREFSDLIVITVSKVLKSMFEADEEYKSGTKEVSKDGTRGYA